MLLEKLNGYHPVRAEFVLLTAIVLAVVVEGLDFFFGLLQQLSEPYGAIWIENALDLTEHY